MKRRQEGDFKAHHPHGHYWQQGTAGSYYWQIMRVGWATYQFCTRVFSTTISHQTFCNHTPDMPAYLDRCHTPNQTQFCIFLTTSQPKTKNTPLSYSRHTKQQPRRQVQVTVYFGTVRDNNAKIYTKIEWHKKKHRTRTPSQKLIISSTNIIQMYPVNG